MKLIIYKTSAVGPSLPVPGSEFTVQLEHLVLYVDKAPGGISSELDGPVLIGQVAFVRLEKPFVKEITDSLDSRVSPKRLTDIVDLDSGVFSFRVWQKHDPLLRAALGSDVDHAPIWALPNGMELSLNQNLLPLSNAPAHVLFSAVTNNMLFNDRETFIQWLIEQGLARDIERLTVRDNLPAESPHVAG